MVSLVKVAKGRFPQHYRSAAPPEVGADVVANAIAIASEIRNDDGTSTPIFTLGHLAERTGVAVGTLRRLVSRRDQFAYRSFRLQKNGRVRGFRTISVPRSELKTVQRWICDQILAHQTVHKASTAYSKGSRLIDAVEPHLGCRWLVKLDLHAFFDSVSEKRKRPGIPP